jgi:hypothetical protein
VRGALAAAAALFLVAHLSSLPSTLEDIDSINFALGVRTFDVAQHQPHPPGYPIFIALGKIATPALRAAGVVAPEVRGLAIWSAIAGAALILLVYALWRTIDGDPRRAAMAAIISSSCPLFWFTALRPLSDVTGLAVALAALAAMVRALPPTWARSSTGSSRALIAGVALAGLGIGVRSQTGVLTLPLAAAILVAPWSGIPMRRRLAALAAGAVGAALWSVPLIVASGGPAAYLAALGSQAGEDLSGVVMLWTHRSARVALFAMMHTFVLPWISPMLAGVMLAVGAGGCLLLMRAPRILALVALMFGPYALFHILFQETVTVRYALPLTIPLAYLVSVVLTQARPAVAWTAAAVAVAVSFDVVVPAGFAFGRHASPVFAMLADMQRATAGGTTPIVGMHRRMFTETKRARQWTGALSGPLLPSPRDYEWLEVTRAWREQDPETTWFVADPRRTDLVLLDSAGRTTRRYRWPFAKDALVGGARPDEIDWHTYRRPGWFLERGWALAPEVAGITERDDRGPYRRPSEGWIRRRTGEAVMMLGGRHLGSASDPPARIAVALDDRPALSVDVSPGFFLRFERLPAGALSGASTFAHLTVSVEAITPGAVPRVGLEQFNVQDPGVVQFGFADGWQEPEYNPQTGRAWRWMSERAVIAVHHTNTDVILRIDGESPMRYYDAAPKLSVIAGSRTLAVLEPRADFVSEVRVPAGALAEADGRIVLTSSAMFIPGDRDGSADRRHLALRVYSVAVSQARE